MIAMLCADRKPDGSCETFRLVEEKLGMGCWSWDSTSGAMEWSRGFMALTGLDPGTVTPSLAAILQIIHPEDRLPAEELAELIRQGTPFDREYRIIRPNSHLRWISSRIEIRFDASGRTLGAVGVAIDVTKHKEQLHYYKRRTDRYEALLEIVDGTISVVDHAGTVVRVLKSTERPAVAPAKPHRWADDTHVEDRDDVEQALAKARHLRTRQIVEHRTRRTDGSVRWTKTTIVPLESDRKRPQEWLHVSIDIDLERSYLPSPANGSLPLTGAQIRAARGMLAMSVKDLANAARISPSTIRRYEEIRGPNPMEEALRKLRDTFESAGVEFVFPKSGDPGLRPCAQRATRN